MSIAGELFDALSGLSTNPDDHPELYETYTLGSMAAPGIVTLKGLARAAKWDVKDADGQEGASTTRKGRSPAKFSADHYLCIDPATGRDEFAEWDEFTPLLQSAQGADDEPIALDFYHPDATRLGIVSVVVEEIGGLQHDGKGGANVTVKFLEYWPPRSKTATGPSGSTSGPVTYPAGPVNQPVDPNAAAKVQLANLVAQAQEPP